MSFHIRIQDLEYLESKLTLNTTTLSESKNNDDRRILSYIISYPYFVSFLDDKAEIKKEDLVILANYVYGWMPTVLVWKNDNFAEVLSILNKVKNHNHIVNQEEFLSIKSLINGSTVGASKVLHFTNPLLYPIWDSKVNLTLGGDRKKTNNVKNYFEYLENFRLVANKQDTQRIADKLAKKLGYKITFARAFEMLLFLSNHELLKDSVEQIDIIKSEKTFVLPKLKRDTFIFISNLNNYTANADLPLTFKRDGYLLSEHYMTKRTINLAELVKKKRNLLISDNGNFTRIKKIAAIFDEKGLDILNTARKEIIDDGAISEKTIAKRIKLIDKISAESKKATDALDVTEILTKQLSIKPDYIIGMEDLAVPAMMLCHLMHPIFNPQPSEVKKCQQRTIDIFSKQNDGHFGSKKELLDVANFLVLHAYDYSSAFQASENASSVEKDGIAISYGGPMLSNRWIQSLRIGDQIINFAYFRCRNSYSHCTYRLSVKACISYQY